MESDAKLNLTAELKKTLRKKSKAAVAQLTEKEKSEKSTAACSFFLESSLYKSSDVILSYAALKSEISTDLINAACSESLRKIAFPRVHENSTSMDFYFWDSRLKEEAFVRGSFGIMEPEENEHFILAGDSFSAQTNVTMIVPGLAFDKSGGRLGKGKGFYDRYIARLCKMLEVSSSSLFLLGMCFDCQVCNCIPSEEHDVKMNGILTESGIVIF
ncbi:5-formyltetrahydrofolate cyclo-ligase [Treponema rectale]|uniref:5-formyltetrahydrofolate cyclo-ligase n=1 Tax=Treponema rectale TaxID=744512 RepID=A0A840SBH0_9SPIR|nr:5-formyltetrahydrofolate cyclo-ligase [Treponema rectale]MBB5218060.1 5-formyltetrahydrofolate cyclo-ligase [Treponema rectale]QOS40225.1 5-formyltetrahydrofolate cyclo-ligase [Treponema rectale]